MVGVSNAASASRSLVVKGRHVRRLRGEPEARRLERGAQRRASASFNAHPAEARRAPRGVVHVRSASIALEPGEERIAERDLDERRDPRLVAGVRRAAAARARAPDRRLATPQIVPAPPARIRRGRCGSWPTTDELRRPREQRRRVVPVALAVLDAGDDAGKRRRRGAPRGRPTAAPPRPAACDRGDRQTRSSATPSISRAYQR